MPVFKTRARARRGYRCNFCRDEIEVGDLYLKSLVKDRYGHFSIRRPAHCDHTADLNSTCEWATERN